MRANLTCARLLAVQRTGASVKCMVITATCLSDGAGYVYMMYVLVGAVSLDYMYSGRVNWISDK